ncbi:MAG TPA: anti-sigma factor [Trebonia sp.]
MGLFSRADDHQWSQRHLSHYAEGDLSPRARRRLERHAEDCADCSRGIRAMRALLRLIPGIEGRETVRAPAGIFDRVRGAASQEGDPAPAEGA